MEKLTRIENDWTASLMNTGFVLYRGWNNDLATAIVQASREPIMLSNVPRDVGERFIDEAAAHDWYGKVQRDVYALFQGDTIAGIAWFSYSPRPELSADYTFAIRMYEPSRGQGLSHDFAKAVQTDFKSYRNYRGGVWIGTSESNIPARKLYEKFGFKFASKHEGRLTLVHQGD